MERAEIGLVNLNFDPNVEDGHPIFVHKRDRMASLDETSVTMDMMDK